MKLIIQNSRIAATATDEYTGPDPFIAAPEDFDIIKISEYVVVDGVLTLPARRKLTRLEFRNRFDGAEKAGLEFAALDNPAGTMEQRMQAAMLRAYLADLAAAEFIDLDDAATVAGVNMLEAAMLIAEGRAAEILE